MLGYLSVCLALYLSSLPPPAILSKAVFEKYQLFL
jgi:hypothetical protein